MLPSIKKIGLNIDNSSEQLKILSLYKKWVSARLNAEQETHIIEIYYPKKDEKAAGNENNKLETPDKGKEKNS